MIDRKLENILVESIKTFPSITIIGPRQSGKTTLVRKLFSDFRYINLENPDERRIAIEDPRSLFVEGKNIIIDEAQKAPEIFSYIQTYLDSSEIKVIVTGSNQFDLNARISQSLAGRTAIFKLLPFSLSELSLKQSTDEWLLKGFYPAIYDKGQPPGLAYRSYFETYLQKDVRQILNVTDLGLFEKFVRICAGRVGNVLNFSSMSNDIGVSVNTLQSWFSVLETSFICYRLPPYYANINKRLTKSPKLYFYDVGLVSYLLRIENESQISRDPLRGAIFENMVINEFIKKRFNEGKDFNGYFYRDSNGVEVDYLDVLRNGVGAYEIKSAATYHTSFKKGIESVAAIESMDVLSKHIIYDGKTMTGSNGFSIHNYQDFFTHRNF